MAEFLQYFTLPGTIQSFEALPIAEPNLPVAYPSPIQKLWEIFGANGDRKTFSDGDFEQIALGLRGLGRDDWSKVPRLYTVLRITGQTERLDDFIDQGLTDFGFPFCRTRLPSCLSSSAREKFLAEQHLVYTKALSLEGGFEKAHVSFGPSEPVPFRFIGSLGVGSQSKVDMVISRVSGREYARKTFRRRTRNSRRNVERHFLDELKILRRLNHRHCIELIASYTQPKHFGLILSPIADCDMTTFYEIVTSDPSKQPILRTFFGCLAEGLAYLHNEKVWHRDIKPENILLKGNCVYWTDFGMSLDSMEPTRRTPTEDVVKSWVYCAPEVADCDARNEKSDIWSLGCVYLEMATVLKGHLVEDLENHLKRVSGDRYFWKYPKAITLWIEILKKEGLDWDNAPLDWAVALLNLAPERRHTANQTKELIDLFSTSYPSSPVSFCGECCQTLEESDCEPEQQGTHDGVGIYHTVEGLPTTIIAKTPSDCKLFFNSICAKLDTGYMFPNGNPNEAQYLPRTRVDLAVDGCTAYSSTEQRSYEPKWLDCFSIFLNQDSVITISLQNTVPYEGPKIFGEAVINWKLEDTVKLQLPSRFAGQNFMNTITLAMAPHQQPPADNLQQQHLDLSKGKYEPPPKALRSVANAASIDHKSNHVRRQHNIAREYSRNDSKSPTTKLPQQESALLGVFASPQDSDEACQMQTAVQVCTLEPYQADSNQNNLSSSKTSPSLDNHNTMRAQSNTNLKEIPDRRLGLRRKPKPSFKRETPRQRNRQMTTDILNQLIRGQFHARPTKIEGVQLTAWTYLMLGVVDLAADKWGVSWETWALRISQYCEHHHG